MDLQSLQRADRVDGPFRAPRFGRPDVLREPDAWMSWVIAERELPRAPGELKPLPWVEDVYTIGPIAAPPERKWYVVVTEPAKERSVCDDLRREGVEPFAPLVRSLITRKGKKRVMTRPLLPRYVFAGLPQQPQTPFLVILEAHGAREILGHSGSPAVIPTALVEDLRQRDADGEWDEEKALLKAATAKMAQLVIGVRVRVIEGPFASFSGLIDEIDYESGMLTLELSIFGRETRASLNVSQIEPLVIRRRAEPRNNEWSWIKKGVRVVVVEGIFAGLAGVVDRAHYRRMIAQVGVESQDRVVTAQLGFAMIELA